MTQETQPPDTTEAQSHEWTDADREKVREQISEFIGKQEELVEDTLPDSARETIIERGLDVIENFSVFQTLILNRLIGSLLATQFKAIHDETGELPETVEYVPTDAEIVDDVPATEGATEDIAPAA